MEDLTQYASDRSLDRLMHHSDTMYYMYIGLTSYILLFAIFFACKSMNYTKDSKVDFTI